MRRTKMANVTIDLKENEPQKIMAVYSVSFGSLPQMNHTGFHDIQYGIIGKISENQLLLTIADDNYIGIVKEAIERMLTIMGGGKYSYNGMNIEVPQTKNNTQNCFDSIVTLLNMKSVSNITETQLKNWTVENENLLHSNMAYSMKTLYDKFKTVPNPIWQYAIPVWEIGIFCIYLATQKIDIRNVTKKDISSLYPQYQEFVGNNIETGIQSFYVLCA